MREKLAILGSNDGYAFDTWGDWPTTWAGATPTIGPASDEIWVAAYLTASYFIYRGMLCFNLPSSLANYDIKAAYVGLKAKTVPAGGSNFELFVVEGKHTQPITATMFQAYGVVQTALGSKEATDFSVGAYGYIALPASEIANIIAAIGGYYYLGLRHKNDAENNPTGVPGSVYTLTFHSGSVEGSEPQLALEVDIRSGNKHYSLGREVRSLQFLIDGFGSAIEAGVRGQLEVPYDCYIIEQELLADQTGSIVVDIWRGTYDWPPIALGSLCASAKPTISSGVKDQDSTLTGWTRHLRKGDILTFNVDSCTSIERCTVCLRVRRE